MERLNEFFPYNVKEPTIQFLKSVSEKSKDVYNKSKEQTSKLGQYLAPVFRTSGYPFMVIQPDNYLGLPTLIESVQSLMKHPTTKKIAEIVEKYIMIIVVFPVIRDLLISTFLKLTGFTAAGIKYNSIASLIQSSFFGGYIAKSSLFAKLQSIGALGIFDPTLITLLLLGGVTFYYFYVYSHSTGKNNAFKWNFKDSLVKSQVTVPVNVLYTKGKFDIKWYNLEKNHSKAWKQLF